MDIFLIFLVIVGVGTALVVSKKNRVETWRRVANKHKLKLHGEGLFSELQLVGKCNGHGISIREAESKDRVKRIHFKVIYQKPVDVQFHLKKQHYYHTVMKKFGTKDVALGDDFFDKRVLIQTSSPHKLKKILTEGKRLTIVKIINAALEVEITERSVSGEIGANYNTFTLLDDVIKMLTMIGDEFSEMEYKKTKKKDNESIKGGEKNIQTKDVDGIRNSVVEGKKEASIDVGNETDMPEQLTVEEVDEPKSDVHEEDKVEEEKQDTHDVKEMEEAEIDSSITQEALCKELFGSDRPSYELETYAKEHYEQRKMVFSGKLTEVSKFSFDMVFKDRKGVKATVELMELKSKFSTTKVKLYACFSEDEFEQLSKMRGHDITLVGAFCSINGFMKQLYVDNCKVIKRES